MTVATTHTTYPPCALRYHPSIPDLLFLGTYKLNEADKSRHGSIDVLMQTDQKVMTKLSTPTESAVLDIKFDPFDDSLLYSAHSTGELCLWKFDPTSMVLSLVQKLTLFDKTCLITSVITSQVIKNRLLLTTTEGFACLVDIHDSHEPETVTYFESQHELECWTGAFGNLGELSSVVFTGGDDGALMAFDTRAPQEEPVFTSKRLHDAGVVAIQTAQLGDHHQRSDWCVNKPYTLWTGSYDDNVRSLDLRCVPTTGLVRGIPPRTSHKLMLGGGVWRFTPSPINGDDRVLTCCMYNGAKILEPDDATDIKIAKDYKGNHESMCYGGDWNPLCPSKVATCSFYDRVVEVWTSE